MMTRDHVIWAGAIRVEEQFGEQGFDFIDHRIETLAQDRDIKGIEMWCKIGEALDRLASPSDLIH